MQKETSLAYMSSWKDKARLVGHLQVAAEVGRVPLVDAVFGANSFAVAAAFVAAVVIAVAAAR